MPGGGKSYDRAACRPESPKAIGKLGRAWEDEGSRGRGGGAAGRRRDPQRLRVSCCCLYQTTGSGVWDEDTKGKKKRTGRKVAGKPA